MPSNVATQIGREKASAKRNAPRLSCRAKGLGGLGVSATLGST
jgi:hypothetical protein